MVVILIKASDTLRIDNYDVHFLPVISVTNQWLAPDPQSFCAGIDCWPNTEATILL